MHSYVYVAIKHEISTEKCLDTCQQEIKFDLTFSRDNYVDINRNMYVL